MSLALSVGDLLTNNFDPSLYQEYGLPILAFRSASLSLRACAVANSTTQSSTPVPVVWVNANSEPSGEKLVLEIRTCCGSPLTWISSSDPNFFNLILLT